MSKIIIADNPLNEISIAQELLPASLEATVARPGTPEFQAALTEAECLVGFGEPFMDDAFYKAAPKLKPTPPDWARAAAHAQELGLESLSKRIAAAGS